MVQKEPKEGARPRGRPRSYDPEAALKSVTDAFWKTGYSGTSLDDLSAATGMNRPSLYAAFGDKRDLYLKALARYWASSHIGISEIFASDRSLRAALLQLYDRAIASYLAGGARGCFGISTATTEALADPKIRAVLMEGLREIDTAFEERLRVARTRGELPDGGDLKTLAMLASAALHTMALRARAGAPRGELEDIAKRTVKTICG
jgi:AcrR family transcriptional regulator